MPTTGIRSESESVPESVFHNVNEPSITLTDTTNKFSSSIQIHMTITQIIIDSYYTNQLQLFSEFVAVELPIPCWVPTMVLRALARNAPRTTLVTLRSEKSAENTKFICTINSYTRIILPEKGSGKYGIQLTNTLKLVRPHE